MTDARERLFEQLQTLGIDAPVVPYPSHRTVAEGKVLRGTMSGTFTKNLLLKDKKGRLFLVAAHEDRAIDLKVLHTRIGANGRLGFASAEQMQDALQISAGTITPLAVINDEDRRVTVVIDDSLMAADQLNFHPLAHTESIGLTPAALLSFVRSCGREPIIASLD